MPLPLLAIAVGAVVGVTVSVVGGYVIEKTIGDGDYSQRDLAIDVGLGLVPGAALAKPAAKILASARHLRHYDPKMGDTLGTAVTALAFVNRKNLKQLGLYGATTAAVGGSYDWMVGSSSGSPSAATGGSGVLTGKGTVQQQLSGFTPPSRRKKRKVRSSDRCGFIQRSTGRQCVLPRGHSGSHRFA